RLSPGLDSGDGGPQHGDDLRRFQLVHSAGGRARTQEGSAPDRAGRAADAAGDDDGDLLQEGADVGAVETVPVLQHQFEAAGHRVAEVAVTDDRVQVTEVLLVVHRDLRDGTHDDLDVAEAGCGHRRSLALGLVAAGHDAGQVGQADPAAGRGTAAVGEHVGL